MRVFRGTFLISAILVLVAAAPALADKGDEEKGCLECHPKFFKEREREFNHQPFADKKCEVCHVFHKFTQQMELAGTVFDLCSQCHESLFLIAEDDLHYPVYEDDGCMTCHEPHSADNEMLLKGTPPGMCLECHEDEPGEDDVVHPPFEDQECAGCHDPHGTEFTANLLLPTYFVCLDCHEDLLMEFDHSEMHSGDGIRSCENCHVGHFGSEAHLLRDSVPGLCFKCHQDQKDALDAEYAHDVLEDCLDCHTPHQHRADIADKALCAECHDFEDEDFLVEHEIDDIESCVDCHNPHGSSEEFMLE